MSSNILINKNIKIKYNVKNVVGILQYSTLKFYIKIIINAINILCFQSLICTVTALRCANIFI